MLTRESSDLVAGDGRTVTVQLAEWGEPRTVSDDGRTEYLEAFDSMDPAGKIRVKSAHDGDLIGHAVADSYSPEPQPTIDLHLAETAAGNDTLALIRSGAIDAVSVEFVPSGDDYERDGVLHRVAARINGVAMAFTPAHSAPILALRETPEHQPESDTKMTEAITPDAVTAADLAVFGDDLKREVLAAQPATSTPTHALAQYRGIGELTRDLINGVGDVKELQRVLADNIIANSPGVARPKFINDVKQTVDFGRPTITAFGTESVANGEGMSINWPVNANDETTLVGLQATEKTDVTTAVWNITNGTAALGTYAGASDVSYALLRRSTPSYLAQYTAALYRGYAITTDIAAAGQVVAAATAGPAWNPATGDADGLRAAVFAASVEVESATNMPATFILAASDAYVAIGGLDGLYPAPYGTQNVSGTATAGTLTVNVSGIPVIHDRFLAAGSIIVSNSSTGAWHEDGPFQVSSEDVEKMGRNIGVFGMGVFTDYVPAGIIAIPAA